MEIWHWINTLQAGEIIMSEDERLEKLMKPEYLSSLTRVVEIIKKLDNLGLLDLISGILSDDETLKKVFSLLTSDDVLSLITKTDSVMALLKIMSDEKNVKALSNLLEMVTVIQNKGLLDPVLGVLKDDKAIGTLIGLVSNDFTMNLIMNQKTILNSLGTLDLSVTPRYINMFKAIENAIKTDKVTPVDGMIGTLHVMKDEDVQKGLGIVFSILRSLGKTCSDEFNFSAKK